MNVEVSDSARKTLAKLDKATAKRLIAYLKRLATLADPTSRGKGLSANLAGCYRYRVGDYRIICRIRSPELSATPTIEVIKIGHRKDVYE